MAHDVRHYELADDAPATDRATLRIWKLWVIWLRPILVAVVLMSIVSAFVGTTVARSGGIDNGFVGVWSPANYAAAVNVSPGGATSDLTVVNSAAWERGILAQFLSVLAAAALVWPVLSRTLNATRAGGISGLVVVAMHLTLSNQWSLQPIVAAPVSYQAAAVTALWLLPVVTATCGWFIERRRG